MYRILFLLSIFAWTVDSYSFKRCFRECVCEIVHEKKVVKCLKGNLSIIPTSEIDYDTHVLLIDASPDYPNHLTLGRIFIRFKHLEEIRITHSNIPAIGDSTFLPGNHLRILDLSHNNITRIFDTDFKGLKNLQVLLLSDNRISAIPSAVFQHLSNLTTLSLARNMLQTLAPRNFYLLPKLSRLDLSGNPLNDIDPENLKDLKPLKSLSLANCRLTRLHSLLYQQLSNIEELDLTDNLINFFQPDEFRHLKNLKILRLDGNFLRIVVEKTFDGHNLQFLGLSRNEILSVNSCAFCNASIKELDISNNHMAAFNTEALKPIALSLQSLNLGFNGFSTTTIINLLRPLRMLKKLTLHGMRLRTLPEELFYFNPDIEILNLAQNKLENISYSVILPLKRLEILDLSMNKLKTLSGGLLEYFNQMQHLSKVYLHSNPWACNRCNLNHMIRWFNMSKVYVSVCETSYKFCALCNSPMSLAGRGIHTLKIDELDTCADPLPQPIKSLSYTSKVGLLAAGTVILLLLILLIVLIVILRRPGAVYYTREGEQTHTSFYESSAINGEGLNGHLLDDNKKAMFVATTMDIYDDINDEKLPSKNGKSKKK